MTGTTFRAPWGRSLVLTTTVQALVLLAVSIAALLATSLDTEMPSWQRLLAVLLGVGLPLTVLGAAARYGVHGYTVSDDSIRVHRLGWSSTVDVRRLESATISPHVMRRSVRELGNGGLFAYTGRFRNARLGSYRAFVTDHSRTVVLRLLDNAETRVIVVSPDDPCAFVALLADKQATPESLAETA